MQLGSRDHFDEIVIQAWKAYLSAESRLSAATAGEQRSCELAALREGGAATFYLHHFADIVAAENPQFLPRDVAERTNRGRLASVRRWLSSQCYRRSPDVLCGDVSLLGDVADALKHSVLERRVDERSVSARDAVLTMSTGFGVVPFGEGKYGGGPQVIVLANSGPRALSAILLNVLNAWNRGMGDPLATPE
jgi:hypothetical protein